MGEMLQALNRIRSHPRFSSGARWLHLPVGAESTGVEETWKYLEGSRIKR